MGQATGRALVSREGQCCDVGLLSPQYIEGTASQPKLSRFRELACGPDRSWRGRTLPTIWTLAAAHMTGQSLCPDAMSQCTQCHRQRAWEACQLGSLGLGMAHFIHSLPPSFIRVTNQQHWGGGVRRAWSNGCGQGQDTSTVKD